MDRHAHARGRAQGHPSTASKVPRDGASPRSSEAIMPHILSPSASQLINEGNRHKEVQGGGRKGSMYPQKASCDGDQSIQNDTMVLGHGESAEATGLLRGTTRHSERRENGRSVGGRDMPLEQARND
eukprot:scaffold71021_cov33-Tisochrysis_lutea.AAC.3